MWGICNNVPGRRETAPEMSTGRIVYEELYGMPYKNPQERRNILGPMESRPYPLFLEGTLFISVVTRATVILSAAKYLHFEGCIRFRDPSLRSV
jgi:hypothetical protein